MFCLIMSAICGWLVQATMLLSLKYESPSAVQMIGSLNVLISLLGDYLMFGRDINLGTITGSAIMIGSLIALAKTKVKK